MQDFDRKCRFQVEREFHAPAVDECVDGVAAHPQRHGAFDAAFRESDLAELLAYGFAVDEERRADVAQQQLVQLSQLRVRRDERRERRTQRFDVVPRLAGERVAVARRAGGGVGDAARGDDHPCGLFLAFEAAAVHVTYAEDLAAERHQPCHARVEPEFHAVVAAPLFQRVGHVPRLAAAGKYAVAAFEVEFQAPPFEEADGRAVVEFGECRREEIGVGAHLLGELLRRAGVGQVAAPLARDADLAARLLHLFDYEHLLAVLCGRSCGHHACGAGAYDDYVVHFSVVFCLPKIRLSEGNCKHCLLLPLLNSYL